MSQAGPSQSEQIPRTEVTDLIQAIPGATLLCNADGGILLSNQAADQLLGGPAIGSPIIKITTFFPGFTPTSPGPTDFNFVKPDGTLLRVRVEASALSGLNLLLVSLSAIETERPLPREPVNWQDVVALAPAVFCSFGLDETGVYVSPRADDEFAALLGIRQDHIEEDLSKLYSRISAEERQSIQHGISHSQATMTPWRAELHVPECAGPERTAEERWIDARFTPALENSTSVVWHGFLSDVTKQRTTEMYRRFLLQLGTKIQRASGSETIAAVGTAMLAEYFRSARCCLSAINLSRMESTVIHQHVVGSSASHSGSRPITLWGNNEMLNELLAGESIMVDNTATHPLTRGQYAAYYGPAGVQGFTAVPLCRGKELAAVISLSETAPRARPGSDALLIRAAADRIWPAYEAAHALAQQRATLQNLSASESRLSFALQAAAIGIWEADYLTGERTVDARCRAMTGFAPGESFDRNILLSRIVPDDRDSFVQKALEYSDPTGSGHFKLEYRIVSPVDGRLRYILAQGQMIFEGEGLVRRAVRSVGTMQDVTALKHGEQALRRANAELESFAYAAAHDLQEPLRNVALSTQLLERQYQTGMDSEPKRLLALAAGGARRMEAMLKDLLSYSKVLTLDETGIARANANLVLASVLALMKSEIKQGNAVVSWDVLPAVAMKAVHLSPVFRHLLSNALKFTTDRTPLIHIGSKIVNQQPVIFVKDNGSGLARQFHERAFGVFKRLHSNDVPGTGMGLAICKRIVEHYGGQIWMESEPGVGTTVLFSVKAA